MMNHYVRAEIIDLVGMVLVGMTQSLIIVYVAADGRGRSWQALFL
jgi:hypothetical protein